MELEYCHSKKYKRLRLKKLSHKIKLPHKKRLTRKKKISHKIMVPHNMQLPDNSFTLISFFKSAVGNKYY